MKKIAIYMIIILAIASLILLPFNTEMALGCFTSCFIFSIFGPKG